MHGSHVDVDTMSNRTEIKSNTRINIYLSRVGEREGGERERERGRERFSSFVILKSSERRRERKRERVRACVRECVCWRERETGLGPRVCRQHERDGVHPLFSFAAHPHIGIHNIFWLNIPNTMTRVRNPSKECKNACVRVRVRVRVGVR